MTAKHAANQPQVHSAAWQPPTVLRPPGRAPQAMVAWQAALSGLAAAGGPLEAHHALLQDVLQHIHAARRAGELSEAQLQGLRAATGAAMDLGSLQGRAWRKPQGYAGSVQMLEDIALVRRSPHLHLRRWDDFFHAQASIVAMRRRSAWFEHQVLQACERAAGHTLRVLNVACGASREVHKLLSQHPGLPVHFTCVDLNPQAISQARQLCAPWPEQVTLKRSNALRLRGTQPFDLVWSAGLLEDFDDRGAITLVTRLLALVEPHTGELVLSNFSDTSPGQAFLTWCDWPVVHRSPARLSQLAERALGAAHRTDLGVKVQAEDGDDPDEGVNLYLRLGPHN